MQLGFIIAKCVEKLHFAALSNCNIHKHAKVCSNSRAYNTMVDKYSYVGSNCTLIAVDIGKYCSIADGCIIGGAQHPIEYVSTSPVFHKGRNSLKTNFSYHEAPQTQKTIIGNDVWIGNNAIIKGGLTIGNGAIIGMGSVVTHNVPDYEIWAGNPAKCIRKRFPTDIALFLLEQEWWNWDDKTIKTYAQYFRNPQELKDALESEIKK